MAIEDTAQRWRLAERNGALWLGATLYLLMLGALLATADALTLSCDRAADRCEFSSRSLVWEPHEGAVALSQVNYLVDTESVTRTGPSRRVVRARYRFVLRDGRAVHLEPTSRTVLAGGSIREAFIAFRLSGDAPTMSRTEVHVGHGGFFALFAMAIGAMVALVGKRRLIEFDFANGRFSVRTSGVRLGGGALDGALSDIDAIETVASGAQLGLWIRTRAGRRARVAFEREGALAQAISQKLGVPIVAQSSAVIEQSADRRSLGPSLLVVALGLGPLALMAVWPIVERLL